MRHRNYRSEARVAIPAILRFSVLRNSMATPYFAVWGIKEFLLLLGALLFFLLRNFCKKYVLTCVWYSSYMLPGCFLNFTKQSHRYKSWALIE